MISELQRETRKQYAGSSDAAAICGIDPYRSAGDVYLEKTGQAEGFAGNTNTERGNLLEPVLLTWAEQKLGSPLSRDQMCVDASGLLCTNFDALIGGDASVEAKTATDAMEWGDEGTDQIPERHVVQAHHGFACRPSLRVCWVPVLLPGYRSLDFRMYRVDRNDELADAIAERCGHFMLHHVKLGIPPDDFKPSLEVLKRVRRKLNKVVPIADALVDRYIAAKAAAKQADDDAEEAQAAVIAALGDAEGGTFGDGRTLTYHSQLQVRLDTDRIRQEYPDIARECEKEVVFRVLRLPRAAKGKKS